jgi:hypothetical protein
MNHCLAQFLRAGLSRRLAKRDFVSRPVVLQNQGMVDGNIRRRLFKVGYRVAPRGHHIPQQPVGLRYSTGWAINEARLDSAPRLYEARTIGCRERPDVKCLDPLCTLLQTGLPMPPVAAFLHSASIFRATELTTQSFSPALSVSKERGNACNQNHRKTDD